jgi:hypothetical protein
VQRLASSLSFRPTCQYDLMADIPYNTDARGLLDSGQPNKKPYDHASPAIPLSPRPHRGDYHYAPPLVTYSPVSDAGKSSSHRGRFLKNGPYAIAVASMVGGIVAAAVVAIVHHAFGTHLRGRSVNERDSLWARDVVQLSWVPSYAATAWMLPADYSP